MTQTITTGQPQVGVRVPVTPAAERDSTFVDNWLNILVGVVVSLLWAVLLGWGAFHLIARMLLEASRVLAALVGILAP